MPVLQKAVQVIAENFVPAHHAAALLFNITRDTIREIDLDVGRRLQAFALHQFRDIFALLPMFETNFIASNMNHLARKKCHHLIENVIQDAVNVLVGGIVARVMLAEAGRHFDGFGLSSQLRVRSDRGGRVPRHFDFRHDLNMQLSRVGDDLFDLFLRIKPFMRHTRELFTIPSAHLRILPLGTDLSELRVFFNFNPPALVIRQVPVKDIHFEQCHLIQQGLHHVHPFEIPCFVEHKASPGETRCVFDAHATNGSPDSLMRQQLTQALHTVENTGRLGGPNDHSALSHRQGVSLFSQMRELWIQF